MPFGGEKEFIPRGDTRAAEAAIEYVGLEVSGDYDKVLPSVGGAEIITSTTDGLSLVHARPLTGSYVLQSEPLKDTFNFANLHLLNGRLQDKTGCVNLMVEYGKIFTKKHPARYVVDVVTSPAGYNAAQTSLGRQPGVDSLSYERRETQAPGDATEFLGWEIVDPLAESVMPIADWSQAGKKIWTQTHHDLKPEIHGGTFAQQPTFVIAAVTRQAQAIKQTMGEGLYSRVPATKPGWNEKDAVARLMFAMDNYDIYYNRLAGIVEMFANNIEQGGFLVNNGDRNIPIQAYWNTFGLTDDPDAYDNSVDSEYVQSLTGLGVLPSGGSKEAERRGMRSFGAAIVKHAAGLSIILETERIADSNADTIAFPVVRRQRRIEAWHTLIQYMDKTHPEELSDTLTKV